MRLGTTLLLATTAVCLAWMPLQAQMNGHSPAAQAVNDPTRNGMTPGQSSGNMDELFLKKAAAGNMTEVAMGKMALTRTSNDDVKAFAQKMVDDHTAMENDVEGLAKGMNVTLPTAVPKSEEKTISKMEALKGDAFDKAYASAMVKAHKKDLSEFRSEIASTQNAQIKDLATKGADTIANHLKMAEEMNAKVNKK